MKNKLRDSLVTFGILAMVPAYALAQTEEEELFELSPFVVDGSDDEGYRATSTLAGTRLKTSLKDVGSAISVVTSEFLEDTGSTSVEDLFVYTTNTEVGGVQGNFTNSTDSGNGATSQSEARSNPQGNTRIRGLVSANLARDYYRTKIGFDSYNTQRVTINRGPNSILFGMGSPGGVVNNSLVKAVHSESINKFTVRLGERGTHRETFDLNRSLIDDRLAVRIAGLNEQTNYQQEPANEKNERLFGTFDLVLANNDDVSWLGKTSFSANAEIGRRSGSPPNVVPPVDAMRYWYEEPNWAALEAAAGYPRNEWVPDAQEWVKQQTIDNSKVSLPQGLSTPAIWRQLGIVYPNASVDQASLGIPGSDLQVLMGLVPGAVLPGPTSRLYFTRELKSPWPGFSRTVLQDTNIFDYENILITGETETVDHDFEAYSASFEQLFLNGDAGLQVGYFYEEYEKDASFSFDRGIWNAIQIDQAEYLTNGEPNPNLGRPALVSSNVGDHTDRYDEQQSIRVTPFYEFDFADKVSDGWASKLGRHVFTGLYDRSTNYKLVRNYAQAWTAEDFEDSALGDNRNLNTQDILAFRRQAGAIAYIGPSLLDVDEYSDIRLNDHLQITIPKDGDTFKTYYYNKGTKDFDEGTVRFNSLLNGGRAEYQEFDAQAISMQNYWFNGNVVTLYGWRKDSTRDFEDREEEIRDPVTGWDPSNLDLDYSEFDETSGQTRTWSVVGHLPTGLTDGIPMKPELSFFYNESENFTPSGLRRNEYNEIIGPQSGDTREYGVSLDMMEGKLSFRLNWFETGNTNISAGANNGIFNITRAMSRAWVAANDSEDPNLIEETTLGEYYSSWEEVYDTLANDIFPTPTSEALDIQIDLDTGVITTQEISGLTSTASYRAEGVELEMVANPLKGLRIAANVAKQDTVSFDTAVITARFIDETVANLKANHLWEWTGLDENGEPKGVGYGANDYSPAVLVPLAAKLATDNTVSEEQRRWRANLVVNYQFQNNLKGLGVGAAARWQDKAAVGYPLTPVEAEDGSFLQLPVLDSPFYAPDLLNGDIWVSYRRKLGNEIDWKVQLNVKNAFGNDDLIPSRINPDGELAQARIAPTQEFYLTNTFSF